MTPAAPAVSIVLPTHNRPELLAHAVDSVLRQTVGSWELIVVDSASETPISLPRDGRIRLVRLPTNRGPATARNVGIELATGDAITFLDDDDAFVEERLRIGLSGLERNPVAVCGARFFGEVHGSAIRSLDGDVRDTILDGPTPCLGATMVERTRCERFDERWQAVEDVEWWLRTAQLHPVATADAVGYLVRKHDAPRIVNGPEQRITENLDLLEARREWFAAHPKAASYRLRRTALIAESIGDRRLARRLLVTSILRQPSIRSAWHLTRQLRPPARTS